MYYDQILSYISFFSWEDIHEVILLLGFLRDTRQNLCVKNFGTVIKQIQYM